MWVFIGHTLRGLKALNNHMRTLNTVLLLLPSPLFFVGFVYSLGAHGHHHGWEMPLMWLLMSLAHLNGWLFWYQQRSIKKTLPVKQQ